ncbi:type II toxin-antitoxin system prevent-host-death family antitoxin [Nocardia sp. R6R-6]|uniref:type II toxin-antitoxin system prevent-host-death family antitoxin n=1 Tax=Nocardia sp. R6R-6 TaxID=3459303 RepID=UPI00403D9CA3
MKLVSASEASRNFADLLSRAERGETVVITRGGRRLAVIGPAPVANGAQIRAALSGWRERYPDDDASFETDVLGVRDLLRADDPWHE